MTSIISNLDAGLAFETVVIRSLQAYLKDQGKSIEYSNDLEKYDAYLPQGIGQENGPVYLIVKYLSQNKGMYFKVAKECATRCVDLKGTLFFIFGTELTNITKENLKKLLESRAQMPAIVWDINDFQEKTNCEKIKNLDLNTQPIRIIVDDAINNSVSANQQEEAKAALINSLKNRYLEEDVALFLGAGVSIDAGIPLWKQLINDLLSEMISRIINDKQDDNLAKHLGDIINIAYQNQEESPITQMRYIRTAFSHKDYNQLVHDALYQNKPKAETDLINAIASLCTPRRNHMGVQSIVSYNFDDLLERKLKALNVETNIITTEEDCSNINKLSIYHVHGYMPKKMGSYKGSDHLVFSEEDYHRVYRDAYCWSNLAQLNLLRERTCLFIGCSLTDPNLRRLLDIATRTSENPRHYAIMKKQKIKHDYTVDLPTLESYKKIDLKLKEKYYSSMGLNIIWVDDFKEIPEILKGLLK